MERDMEEMKRRLAEMEKNTILMRQTQKSEVQEPIESISRKQADLQASLDTMRVEMQSINGRLEDEGRQKGESREELTMMRDDLALKIKALEDRLTKMEEQAKAQPAPAPPAPPQESPQALYDRGVELVQKGDFTNGRESLQEFLRLNPTGPLTANAMYWVGEGYFGEKKYENAILQFQDVIQKYGEHPKAASALLKQGLTFNMLGDQKNAKVVLKKLVDTFPMSEEAKKAKEKLAECNRR
jgi:tol-pal system protein YbgF